MNGKEIRAKGVALSYLLEKCDNPFQVGVTVSTGLFGMITELAAQVAEANEQTATFRDQLAMAALQGYIGTDLRALGQTTCQMEDASIECYEWADAMLKVRLKKRKDV